MQLILRRSRFVWNLVLFGEPRTEIDEPAAIAAEGPICRLGRPFHRPLAGRTFNYGDHRGSRPDSRTAGQKKRYVHFDVRGAAGRIEPIQKSNGATMLATADFGK